MSALSDTPESADSVPKLRDELDRVKAILRDELVLKS